ncbi:MAG: hypothetical protein HDR02_05495 [Lachnospiraceae bacterium]|nr:hypothetical protein [Lachnospiraceae bacterium]
MKGKMKKILLAVGLCLMIGLQSVGAAQAAVNYEACPFCGTRVIREDKKQLMSLTFIEACETHRNCDIFSAYYEYYKRVTCQTIGCPNFERVSYEGSSRELVHESAR